MFFEQQTDYIRLISATLIFTALMISALFLMFVNLERMMPSVIMIDRNLSVLARYGVRANDIVDDNYKVNISSIIRGIALRKAYGLFDREKDDTLYKELDGLNLYQLYLVRFTVQAVRASFVSLVIAYIYIIIQCLHLLRSFEGAGRAFERLIRSTRFVTIAAGGVLVVTLLTPFIFSLLGDL
ncbi:MAG: hypothetical protein WBX25_16715 [Rhodomicrobium sp.]